MTTDTDLRAAVAEIKRVTPPNEPWKADDLDSANHDFEADPHIATILNAVAYGDLIPRADVDGLVEAAKPLAAMAERYDPPEDCDDTMECWSRLAVPKIGHLRKLRAALTAWENLNG